MTVFYLIYTSKISLQASLQATTFHDICQKAVHNNLTSNITSFLCFKKGHFLQYLEGEKAEVERLFDKIKSDARHKQVRLIAAANGSSRLFNRWQMQCINLDKVEDVEEISPVLSFFEKFAFNHEHVDQLLSDFHQYYRSGLWHNHNAYNFTQGSYSKNSIQQFGTTHKPFLVVQLALLALFIALFLAVWCYQHWQI